MKRFLIPSLCALVLLLALAWGGLQRQRAKDAERESKQYRDQVYFVCNQAAAVIVTESVAADSVQDFSRSFGQCVKGSEQFSRLLVLLEEMRNFDRIYDPAAARREMAELIKSQLPP
jgi:hypothetical protein